MFYKREEYGLLSYFGDLGGLLSCLLFFGYAISSKFVSRLLGAALVKKMYRVQQYLLDTTHYYNTSLNRGKLTSESDSNSDRKGSEKKYKRQNSRKIVQRYSQEPCSAAVVGRITSIP